MDAYQLKPWTRVATPHEDILGGRLEMSTYAADLWAVVRKDPHCPRVYREPRDFFEATYLTAALRKLLGDVLGVLGGGSGDRVLQLRTPFGGGKTHSLIALYHFAAAQSALADLSDLEGLPNPGPVRVAVLHGLELDPHVVRKPDGGPPLCTLWGELAWQLGGVEAYEMVRAQDEARAAPGGEVLRQLLGDGPTLILFDEAVLYVHKAMTIPVRDSTLGRQVIVFLQTLTEAVRGLPQAALVYSLPTSGDEAAGDEALLQNLDHLVSRVDAKREPVSGDEVMRVVQRRLFKDLGEETVRQEVARTYAELYRRLREGFAQTESDRREAAHEAELLEERILKSYPFHPDLLDLMYHRWGSLPSYQRTRGALQFLATTVYALWRNPQFAQPLVGPGDVLFTDEAVRGAFFSQVGERERYTAVLDADLTGTQARVREVDRRVGRESPALEHLRVGTRLATAAFLYSFGAREGEERGVVESELITSCLAPRLDRLVLTATLSDLREELLYLHYTSRRYRFEPRPNLNKLIADEARKFNPEEVLDRVREELRKIIGARHGVVLWPESSEAISDREPEFKVVYLHPSWAEKAEEESGQALHNWIEYRGNSKREYLNALAFTLPVRQPADRSRAAARQLLGIESLLSQKTKLQLSAEQVEELEERRSNARTELEAALRQLYERVRFPVPEREGKAPYILETVDLRTQLGTGRDIHGHTLEALRNWVFDYVTPTRLLALTRLGQPCEEGGPAVEHLVCDQVVRWFFSYLDFPKMWNVGALQKCVAQGVADKDFGYVAGAGLDEQGEPVFGRAYVRFGKPLRPEEIDLSAGAYLLSAELATRLTRPEEADKGVITGRVQLETEKDGVPGEKGLAGVTVRFEQGGVEVGRVLTDQDGRYASPPLSVGQTKVVCEAGPQYMPTTPSVAEVPVSPQAKETADFGLRAEEKPGRRRYRLRVTADKSKAFTVFTVLQNLADRAEKVTVSFDIVAEAEEGFDPVWLRNAVEEPLDEADITTQSRLEG